MQDRRDRGFTIIELLVVTMIILLLISLLMPAFRGSVTVSQMALCQSNQHQQGLGMLGYATTYSAFPGAHSISENGKTIAIWVTRCRAFMSGGRGPFYCPAEPAGWAWQTVYGSGTDYATANDVRNWMYEPNELLLEVWAVPFSYGYNDWGACPAGPPDPNQRGLGGDIRFGGTTGNNEILVTHVRQPAQMIAVGDSLNTGNWRFNIDPTTPSEFPSDIHRGGADFLFADGHVEYRLQSQMAFGSTAYSGWTAAQQQTARLWNNTNIGDPSVIP